ncbi:hypothetical protein C8R47DRAFT_1224289 [Mycena vitilis]|nr:hypothetical protein C8R47DRAFT_1224289 [Mycena vitilis]
MSSVIRDNTGRILRVFRARVDPDDEFSCDWIGINKPCSSITPGALALIDDHHYQDSDCPTDEFGRFTRLEWADQPDWFHPETHARGWIPLAKENDQRRGAWAMQTKMLFLLGGPSHLGQWRLAEPAKTMVLKDLAYWRNLLEEVGASELYDRDIHVPPFFDSDRVGLEYASEKDVHCMVMDARRAILDIWGHLSWWIASVPNWMEGLTFKT